MKNTILIALLATSVLFITCCKKKQLSVRYPEDTEDTYLTPPERLCNKWWILDSVSLNGMDYTDTLDLYIGEYKFYINSEEIEYHNTTIKYRIGKIETDKWAPEIGIMAFFDEPYQKINFSPATTPFQTDTVISYAPYLYHPYTSLWEIRKLTKDQIKIQIQHKDTTIINDYKSI
jgi:hypothetical protein